MASQIGTLGNLTNLTIGGQTFVNAIPSIGKPIILYATIDNTNLACTFRISSGTAGYTVTSGKTLTIYAMSLTNGGTASGGVILAQTDNDVGFATTGTFTNPVYLAGSSVSGSYMVCSTTISGQTQFVIDFPVASTKYISCRSNGSSQISVILYGYEA